MMATPPRIIRVASGTTLFLLHHKDRIGIKHGPGNSAKLEVARFIQLEHLGQATSNSNSNSN
jgi:hypothetical protein